MAESHGITYRNEGQTPQYVASYGEVEGKPQPRELGETCCNNTGGLQGRRTRGAVYLADGGDNPKEGRH